MIEANELRRGNLVDWNGEKAMVWLLLELEVVFKCGETDLYTALKPIEPTEKILLKYGFELEYKSNFTIKYTHKESMFGYDWNKREGWGFRYYGKHIKCDYLHQIQNLYFVLAGKELTAWKK